MTASVQRLRDPVCKMWVGRDEHALDSMGMHFAFCSIQCRERFMANPHLFIGQPGEAAPVQRGEASIKHRRLRLAAPLDELTAVAVPRQLTAMMGVEQVKIIGKDVHIRYDLLQVTAEQIEAVIAGAGGVLSQRWLERMRRGLVHTIEANEVDAREVTTNTTGSGHRH